MRSRTKQPTADLRCELTQASNSAHFVADIAGVLSHVVELVSSDAIAVGHYRSCGKAVHEPEHDKTPCSSTTYWTGTCN